jgi:hypothetical protein
LDNYGNGIFSMDIYPWIIRGREEGRKILLIVLDLEDKEFFPVYFDSEKEANRYSNNIISESKAKVVSTHIL